MNEFDFDATGNRAPQLRYYAINGRPCTWWQICYHVHVKIVVDTDVFVGACMGVGASSEVIAVCLRGQASPLMGCALFSEYEDVLGRSELFNSCRLDATERNDLLDIFLAVCTWTRIYYSWRPNLRDEADNHIVELAIAGGADCIVTRNLRDLTQTELCFPQLSVLTPEAFLKEVRK